MKNAPKLNIFGKQNLSDTKRIELARDKHEMYTIYKLDLKPTNKDLY